MKERIYDFNELRNREQHSTYSEVCKTFERYCKTILEKGLTNAHFEKLVPGQVSPIVTEMDGIKIRLEYDPFEWANFTLLAENAEHQDVFLYRENGGCIYCRGTFIQLSSALSGESTRKHYLEINKNESKRISDKRITIDKMLKISKKSVSF